MKSLNNILNDVMSDIITEGFWGPVEYKMPTDPKEAADLLRGQDESFLRAKGLDPEKLRTIAAMGKVSGAIPVQPDPSAEIGQSVPLEAQRNSLAGDPRFLQKAASEASYQSTMNDPNANFFDRAGATLGYGFDKASAAWADASPMEKGLMIGIPTALAAGAGALYLRKKQREANRAAGI